ncbi:MAG TPA: ATP synthase F1 subunit epsilon [Burkholderiaceae bacterium]|nr:ATP synthase F1 subunit epsilon [Burkholderiaceae bacterium]
MRLSVTTPRGAVVDTDVDELTAPGQLGEFGVLPGHVPLMSALKPGVLTYWTQQRAATLAVGEGFLQVAPVVAGNTSTDHVLVLVDRASNASGIDRAAAAAELTRLEREIAAWKQDLDGSYKALVVQRDWAQAQLDAAAKSNPS